jgi:BMFP domain-containing protein YqiC
MQSQSTLFDEAAKVMTAAMGAAQAAGEEAKSFIRSQADRIVADMDLVSREEHEALRDLASRTQTELDEVKGRLASLEAMLSKAK